MVKDSSFWAEDIVKQMTKIKRKEYVCEGMWTPSGYFHIGNARPEIFTPYTVFLELEKEGFKTRQNLVYDDFDPLKKIPAGIPVTKEQEKEFLGKPVKLAPSPFEGHKSWADYFETQVTEALPEMGLSHLNIQSAYDNYKEGKMNDLIIFSLSHAKEIVKIWNEVSGSEKPESFLPVTMICEKCGRMNSTEATNWDGKKVKYKCECGYEKEDSPLDGKGKLHWRVHWVAHWVLNNVAFESGGKDHFSKGSSVDVGRRMIKEVFKKDAPVGVPTEFIQVGGAKMAGSVGNVVDLKEWLRVASPETFRYLYLSNRPNHVIEFSLNDNSFILLNERFERAERVFYGKEKAENEHIEETLKRAYEMSVIGKTKKDAPTRIPYSFATQIAGIINPNEGFSEILGLLKKTKHIEKISKENEENLKKEFVRARNWVEKYNSQNLITFNANVNVKEFSEFKELFSKSAQAIKSKETQDDIQQAIYEIAKELKIEMNDAFKVFYQLLIGKERGPRLGTLIMALGKEKVIKRLKEFN